MRLLLGALDARESIDTTIQDEAQSGAFACAGAEEAERLIALWRQVMHSVCTGHPELARRGQLERAFARLREPLVTACARADGERIDILALGGSAGGIQAIGTLLGAFTRFSPATVLIVLHTHPSSPALMPLVLSRFSSLPIAFPTDGGLPILGTAYVAPPGRHLAIEDGRFRLLDSPRVRYSRPSIDVLFNSAAQSFGRRLASVLVSGTGRDGADGTRAVREHGGFTLAQDPASAEFGTMPEVAIATGAVQIVGDLSRLRRVLRRLVARGWAAVA